MTGIGVLLFALISVATCGDPKKGVGCAHGCNDQTLRNLGVNWHYNWGGYPDFQASVEFVPMCFSMNDVNKIPGYSSHLLGFNEPDNVKQGYYDPRVAATVWNDLSKKAYTIASPVCAGNIVNSTSWLKQFYAALGGDPKIDHIAVHHYGRNATRLKEYLTQIYNDPVFKSKPIWLTEFAAQTNEEASSNPISQAEVDQFIADTVPWLRDTHFVHRYAWHSAANTMALWDGNGNLTPTGKKYAYAA